MQIGDDSGKLPSSLPERTKIIRFRVLYALSTFFSPANTSRRPVRTRPKFLLRYCSTLFNTIKQCDIIRYCAAENAIKEQNRGGAL